jgi:hypothetical protein
MTGLGCIAVNAVTAMMVLALKWWIQAATVNGMGHMMIESLQLASWLD